MAWLSSTTKIRVGEISARISDAAILHGKGLPPNDEYTEERRTGRNHGYLQNWQTFSLCEGKAGAANVKLERVRCSARFEGLNGGNQVRSETVFSNAAISSCCPGAR
jgi:hypothetical protein